MNITQLKPYAQQLIKLGIRRHPPRSLRDLFGLPGPPPAPRKLIQPDVDYHPEAERKPQAPDFAGMWLDEFSNIGNIKDPLGSPMESNASMR